MEALRQVRLDDSDSLGLQQAGHARDWVETEIPMLTEAICQTLHLVKTLNRVGTQSLEGIGRRLEIENVLYCQVALELLGHQDFGTCAILRGGPRVLAEFNGLQGLDLPAHQKIERNFKLLAETDQYP